MHIFHLKSSSRIFGAATLIFSLLFTGVSAQTAKKFYAGGEKFREQKNLNEAISNYTKALEMDPNYEKAYIARAGCYEALNEKIKAAEDYKRATAFSPKDEKLFYNAGRLYYLEGKYEDADVMLKTAIERDKSFLEAIDMEVRTLLKLKKFKEALVFSEQGLNAKQTALTLYNNALVLDSMMVYETAEKQYKQAKYFDSKMIAAYVGLANVQVKLNKADEAMKTCNIAFEKSPENKDVYFARSAVFAKQNDFQNAVNDLTKVIVKEPGNMKAFFERGIYYQKLGQYQNGVNDFTKVLLISPKNVDAYFNRAACYEQVANFKMAAKDYDKIKELSPNNPAAQGLLAAAKQKLFEINRERNRPDITLTNPKNDEKNNINVPGDKGEFVLAGKINDESEIKSIRINDFSVDFNKDTLNPDFTATVNISKTDMITVVATDVYDNTQKTIFTVHKTETAKPLIALIAPYTSFDNEIYLDNTNPDLYVEGKVKDESLIQSIIIEGSNAAYPLDQLNPTFSAKISIANKTKITIKVKDVFGNESVNEFTISREGATATANNPMGTTWVVFIENSQYQNMASLEGPGKDVTMMKSALANYKISKIVHKKDMTKAEIEKFFSIELRDLVKANNVTSLLVWYAGHGKFVNQVGYWIPVDGKADDEFTFLSINNLKASMQAYTKVVHILVVTDACESGPTFYLAMRDAPTEKRCDNWEQTKFKSAQVFSSAGYELASDNSQFTRTFSTALNYNPDGCISIEKIAEKVISAVKKAGSQAPKLGKIAGLEDQGGTFFFIKK